MARAIDWCKRRGRRCRCASANAMGRKFVYFAKSVSLSANLFLEIMFYPPRVNYKLPGECWKIGFCEVSWSRCRHNTALQCIVIRLHRYATWIVLPQSTYTFYSFALQEKGLQKGSTNASTTSNQRHRKKGHAWFRTGAQTNCAPQRNCYICH